MKIRRDNFIAEQWRALFKVYDTEKKGERKVALARRWD